MIGHLDDLVEIWETLDTCFERPEKYVAEALKPIVEFRRYKGYNNTAMREFYCTVFPAQGPLSRGPEQWVTLVFS